MQNKLVKLRQNLFSNRHYARVVAFAVFGMLVGASLTYLALPIFIVEAPDQAMIDSENEVVEVYSMKKSDPVALRIPKINLDTEFSEPLGLTDDKAVEVPADYETVGYYKFGPTPGELGPAVVLGHVDSYQGPAIFFSLGKLEEGDLVYVDRADGTTATFKVTKLERHSQGDFPTEDVYGNLDYAGLRLITCTGIYNHGTLRYSHNLIVYAELVESKE